MRNSYFAASVCVLISACCGASSLLNDQDAGWKRAPSRLDRMPLNFGKRDPFRAMPEDSRALGDRAIGSKWLAKPGYISPSFGKKNAAIFPSFPYDVALSGESEDLSRLSLPDRLSLSDSEAFVFPKRGPLPAGQNRFPGDLDKRLARLDRMPLSFGKRSLWAAGFPRASPAVAEGEAPWEKEEGEDKTGNLLDEAELMSDSPSDMKLPASIKRTPRDLVENPSQQMADKSEGSGAAIQTDLSSALYDLWARRCCGHSQLQVGKRPAGLLDRMPLSFGKRTWEQMSRTQVAVGGQSLQRRALLDRMPLSFGKRAQDLQDVRSYHQAPKDDFSNLHLETVLHKSTPDTTHSIEGNRQGASEELQ